MKDPFYAASDPSVALATMIVPDPTRSGIERVDEGATTSVGVSTPRPRPLILREVVDEVVDHLVQRSGRAEMISTEVVDDADEAVDAERSASDDAIRSIRL